MQQIKIKKLSRHAEIPTQGTVDAACYDLYSAENLVLHPGDKKSVSTGIALEIPRGYYVDIRPRSGVACKNEVIILNSPGTIDADYRGEVLVFMKNLSDKDFTINVGNRIAQMMLKVVIAFEFEEVMELTPTDRGAGGFGSTGK